MNEEKGEGGQKADEVKAAAHTGDARSSSSTASEPSEDEFGKQKRFSNPSSSSLANKIAAFASGVAPVKKGITNASEDAITVEEVLHKLESAARAAAASGKAELPQLLVRSAYEALIAARDDSARLAKELTELKNSRVQLIPPSAWVKREHKYKMDQEKHEHTVRMMQQRIERLELELQVLREGSNVKPLEQRIEELETQLLAASEEKTKVQSKYHELSIKHRQLIETSPQVATIWNEVLQQQHATGTSGDSAAMQRLSNFDLRHTGAHSGMVMPVAAVQQQQQKRNGEASPRKLASVNAATAIFSNGAPVAPAPSAYEPKLAATGASKHPQLSDAGSIEQGPETPVLAYAASPVHAGSGGGAAAAVGASAQPQSAEERAAALMQAVALEGLSPEASIAALQQLNYDLTMQLGLYQQMVARLKDAMEQGDLEKAELEADKLALEAQLHVVSNAVAAAGGDHSQAAALMATANSAGSVTGGGSRAGKGGWGFFWRRTGAGNTGDDDQGEGSLADASSIGLASLNSSRRSSLDLDAAQQQQQLGAGGSPTVQHSSSRQSGAAPGTPNSAAAEEDGQQQQQQQQQQLQRSNSGDASPQHQHQRRVSSSSSPSLQPAGSGSSPAPAAASSVAALFTGRRARAAARAASSADSLQKEMKELRRQLTSVQDENKFLVQNLVEIKMELAETQSNHDQAKRALVRAMDKEACLDMRVGELTNMLDMVTQQQQQQQQQSLAGIAAVVAEGAVSVAESAGAAAAAAINAAGAEYTKTRNRRAASRRNKQGAGEQQAGSASEGASGAAIAVAGHSHSQIKRHRSLPTCQAGEQDIGGYTPASYISFSEDPSKQCHHRAEVVVDAPIEACFAMWSDWSKLVDFMDLIGQIGLDNNTPEMALFQCFYRWRKLPIMEIVFLLERTTVEPNSFIAFKSVYGMALLGGVTLQEQDDGRTKVQLYFTHPIPNLLAQMHVGPFGVETHMMQILKDNMATYKAKVEEAAPADWQQAKQQELHL
ncbi:hypothetical protein OEZ85_005281 [Tetradesmus obliquus]|uniref:START domain-containing protein n=1 Tax=Tetradesmus obliquus TaxID=3088 RepID=A0ABY8UI29_TETOB|nr:hypothetical protein OEZ85_005281 [Tetradesmus obliquus]